MTVVHPNDADYCPSCGRAMAGAFCSICEPWCPDCDGCGWNEGGTALQTTCSMCKGSGHITRKESCLTAPDGACIDPDPCMHSIPAAPAPEATSRKPFCHSGADGDCDWPECPQNRDGEPDATGRDCPLFAWDDDDAGRSMILAAATEPAAPEATREAGERRVDYVEKVEPYTPEQRRSLLVPLDDLELLIVAQRYEKTVRVMEATLAAQARENETLRADNQRLALRVKTLLAGRATAIKRHEGLSAEFESLPRWGMVSRDGEAPELDHSPRGTFLSRNDVLRALAAHAPER